MSNRWATALRRLLSGSIDARTARGKLELLFLLALLAFLFNWEGTFARPVHDVMGVFHTASEAPTDPAVAAAGGGSDRRSDLARIALAQLERAALPILTAKIAHPFEPLDLTTDVSGHFEKIAFRFVPFLIAHVLRLDQPGLCRLQILLGLIFPLVLWRLLFDTTGSLTASTAGVVVINGLYLGCAFFVDRVFFDSFAYFFLLCAMLRQPRWASTALMLCAAFSDERAVVAACLVPIWRLLSEPPVTGDRARREGWWQLGFLLSYAALRLAIGAVTGLETGHRGISLELLQLNLLNIVLLVWSVFEGGWLLIVLAAFGVWDSGRAVERAVGAVAIVCLVGIFLAGMLIGDAIRSHQYAFPLLVTAIAVGCRQPGAIPRRIMALAVGLTLITPVTIYLGMQPYGDQTVYNVYLVRPGYLDLFGL